MLICLYSHADNYTNVNWISFLKSKAPANLYSNVFLNKCVSMQVNFRVCYRPVFDFSGFFVISVLKYEKTISHDLQRKPFFG